MYLQWAKAADGGWFSLDRVTSRGLPASGVYIVWKPGSTWAVPSQTIRVGRGDVAQGLTADRLNLAVSEHGPGLLVTWAAVGPLSLDGIELYLTQRLHPLVGARFPLAVPIEVNVPMAA